MDSHLTNKHTDNTFYVCIFLTIEDCEDLAFYIRVNAVCVKQDGFGGLMVSMPASGTRVCGFNPGRSRWIFLVW
jgi:hypothetical protein